MLFKNRVPYLTIALGVQQDGLMERSNDDAKSEKEAQNREVSLAVLAVMRRKHLSFEAATDEVGIDRKTALRHIGSELRQVSPHGRYVPTPYDVLPRRLYFTTPGGTIPITVHDSRIASRIGEHMNAIRAYRNYGDSSALESFRGETFEAEGGVTYEFVTDLATLHRLADAGHPPFQ